MSNSTKEFRTLGKSDELPNNYVVPYYLKDLKHRVSVARVADKLYAFDDLSTSDLAPLSAGLLTGTTLMSQCDGSRFDVTTGRVINGPATEALGTYEVREQDGEIQVRI
jgi:3-phenylpropionate/trans-cinnamate dioxygenase ferredoxin component